MKKLRVLSKYSLVSLDTNIFIYYFQEHHIFGDSTKNIFQSLFLHQTKLVTSVISLTEVLSLKASPFLIKTLQQEFLSIPLLNIVQVDNEIAIQAAEIRRQYHFSLPDAIQLATALQAKAKAFITNDERLNKFKELQVVLINEIS